MFSFLAEQLLNRSTSSGHFGCAIKGSVFGNEVFGINENSVFKTVFEVNEIKFFLNFFYNVAVEDMICELINIF